MAATSHCRANAYCGGGLRLRMKLIPCFCKLKSSRYIFVVSCRLTAFFICGVFAKITEPIQVNLQTDLCLLTLYVVALLFNVHGKHLRSCRDGQLT